MQNDLISRSALLAQLTGQKIKAPQLRYVEGHNDAIVKVRKMILNAPAVDFQPVRHGVWIETEHGYICSACNDRFVDGYYWNNKTILTQKYCTLCGARMEGVRSDAAD